MLTPNFSTGQNLMKKINIKNEYSHNQLRIDVLTTNNGRYPTNIYLF